MIKDNDKLDLSREIEALRKGKLLYVISFVLAFGLAVFYAVFSSPVYHNEAVVMIEQESGSSTAGLQSLLSGKSSMANLFSLTGLGSSSMDDELILLRSHECYSQAISNLGTNRMYTERVGLNKKSLYKKSPVLVEAPKAFFDTISTSLKFTIELTGNGAAKAKVSTGFMGMTTLTETASQPLPFQVQTIYGTFHLLKTDFYTDSKDQIGRKINVQITRNGYAAEGLQQQLTLNEVNKKSNAVELDFDIQDPAYGRDMIGSLISSYRMMRRQHKAEQAASKISFLDKRIEILTNQLDTTASGVQEYMRENQLIDVDTQAALLLHKTSYVGDSIFALKLQQNIHETILQTLKDPANQYQMLVQDSKSPLISAYNELIMERTEMLQSAKPGNAMLQNLETRIQEMRANVIEHSTQVIAQNKMVINSLSRFVGNEAQTLSTMPNHKLQMLNNERDLQLKNGLLIYLLQERENALLSLNSEDDAGFVVDKPFTAKKTVKKKMIIVTILLLFMAAVCPTAWILFRMPRKKEDLLVSED